MILTLIKQYVEERFNILNERFDANLKSMQSEFIDSDFINVPASRSNNYYQINIDDYSLSDEYESRVMSFASVRIEFSFFMGAKKYSDYENIFNTYLFNIVYLINQSNCYYVSEDTPMVVLNDINSVSITNASRIENNYYRPSLEFVCRIATDVNETIFITENIQT